MHTRLNERIRELEAELAALKNTEHFDDLDSLRKAVVLGYGKKKFIKDGWDDNVIGGNIERTYGADHRRYDVYFVLMIQTKSLRIKLEYECMYECDSVFKVYLVDDDGTQTKITEPCGNDFEQRLIKMMLRNLPQFIEQFDEN
jgi:hypothetical protein